MWIPGRLPSLGPASTLRRATSELLMAARKGWVMIGIFRQNVSRSSFHCVSSFSSHYSHSIVLKLGNNWKRLCSLRLYLFSLWLFLILSFLSSGRQGKWYLGDGLSGYFCRPSLLGFVIYNLLFTNDLFTFVLVWERWPRLCWSSAGEAGGDHQEPGGLLHEDRDQDLQGPRAQVHHVPHDQWHQVLHQRRVAGQPLLYRGHGKQAIDFIKTSFISEFCYSKEWWRRVRTRLWEGKRCWECTTRVKRRSRLSVTSPPPPYTRGPSPVWGLATLHSAPLPRE